MSTWGPWSSNRLVLSCAKGSPIYQRSSAAGKSRDFPARRSGTYARMRRSSRTSAMLPTGRPVLRTAAMAATAMVFLLGVARMGSLAIHSPMLGYANNWDFIKLSRTVGIWVDEPGVDPLAAHVPAPYSRYRTHGERDRRGQYLSSELVLLVPAIAVGDVVAWIGRLPAHRFDLRILGLFKCAVFSFAGAWLTVLFFRRSIWLGIGSAVIFAVVIADPMNTLYFNTLYFDDSAVLFTWLAVGSALLLLHGDRRPRWLMPAFCVSLFLAALSKMQHPGVALAIVLGFAIGLVRWERPLAARMLRGPLVAAVLALCVGFVNNQSRSLRSMAEAAATDTWFWTVLPALRAPAAVLAEHGIPARCASYVGKSWYHPGMQPPPCPEIFRLSRISAVLVLLREPSALFHLIARGVATSRPFLLPYGHVERREGGRVDQEGTRFA